MLKHALAGEPRGDCAYSCDSPLRLGMDAAALGACAVPAVATVRRSVQHQPMPQRVEPMLARLSGMPARPSDYAFEIKWDGWRCIAFWNGRSLRLQSRNLRDLTAAFPEMQALGKVVGRRRVILDGELICLDGDGRPCFELLQPRLQSRSRLGTVTPARLVAFDVLWLARAETMTQPYTERRALLERLEFQSALCTVGPSVVGEGEALRRVSLEHCLEGILAKRLDSTYRPGIRDGSWLKIKNFKRQPFIVTGWRERSGDDDWRDWLRTGYYDSTPEEARRRGAPQRLIEAGGIGVGFTRHDRERLMQALHELELPAAEQTSLDRGIHRVRPELVIEAQFQDWTSGGAIRHGCFKRVLFGAVAHDVVAQRSTGATA